MAQSDIVLQIFHLVRSTRTIQIIILRSCVYVFFARLLFHEFCLVFRVLYPCAYSLCWSSPETRHSRTKSACVSVFFVFIFFVFKYIFVFFYILFFSFLFFILTFPHFVAVRVFLFLLLFFVSFLSFFHNEFNMHV